MREYYEKLLSQGVDRENFMTKYRASCALFVPDPGALDRVIESQVKQKDPKVADLQLVLRSSAVLKVVFSELALKMDFLEYIKRARHALRDLEHNNFDMDEYHNLQRIMQSDAEKLVHAGLRSFDKKQTLVPIFDTFVQVMVHTVYDEFTFRLNARIVSIGVNTGVLPLLPWEQLFYKPGHIEGVSTATKLPAELLEEHMNVRQSVLKALGDRPLTLSQMRREVGWRVKGFLALSRTFSIEWAFLNTFAEMKACDTGRAGILASLPTGSEPLTFKEALSKLDDLRKSDLVFAAERPRWRPQHRGRLLRWRRSHRPPGHRLQLLLPVLLEENGEFHLLRGRDEGPAAQAWKGDEGREDDGLRYCRVARSRGTGGGHHQAGRAGRLAPASDLPDLRLGADPGAAREDLEVGSGRSPPQHDLPLEGDLRQDDTRGGKVYFEQLQHPRRRRERE